MNIRAATWQDAPMISGIHAAAWRYSYRNLLPEDFLDHRLPESRWRTSFHALLESGQIEGLILEEQSTAVGCCLFGRGRDAAYGDWGEIISLYLLPDYMHRGYGREMLQIALRALKADGYDCIYLWSIRGNDRADKFYRKMGFQPTGETISYSMGGARLEDERYVFANLCEA